MAEDAGGSPSAATPQVKGIDVAEAVSAFRQLQVFGTQVMQDMEGAFDKAQAAAGAQGGAAMGVGRAEVDVNNILGAAAAKIKADNSQAAADFGTNPNANTYVIGKMGEQIRDSILKTEQRRQEVQDSLDASFFDNPLAWLGAQVQLPFQQASLELNESRTSSLITSLAKLQNLTLEQGKINAAVDAADGAELTAAQNKLLLAKAAKEASAAQMNLARLGIDRISMRRQLTMDQFDAMIRANSVVQSIQSHDLQQRQFKLQEETHSWQAEEEQRRATLFKFAVEDKQEKEDATKLLQEKLDKAAPLLGMSRVSAIEYRHMAENNPIKRSLDALLFSPDADFNRLGPTPAIALDRVNAVPVQLPALQEDTRQKLMQIVSTARSGKELTWRNLTPEQRQQEIDTALKTYYTEQMKNIPDSGGLYSPPPLASVVNMPVWNNNPIIDKLKVLAVNPNYALRVDDVITAAIEVLRDQTEAGQRPDLRMVNIVANNIAFLYQGIMVDNNTLRQYNKFAIPGLSDETGFKTTVSTGNAIMNTRANINMANKEAVAAFLIRRIANENFIQDAVSGLTGGYVRPQQPTIQENDQTRRARRTP